VISQSPYITHTLRWMNLEHCIVGTSRYEQLGLPHTGGVMDPDREAITELEADIIFSSDWISTADLNEATPEGVRAIRLHGFKSMQEIEENIVTIGEAMGLENARSYGLKFSKTWRARAKQLKGNGQRILLISSCSGMPYSFGRERWLTDFFEYGGFQVVETHKTIRHLRPGQEIELLNDWIHETQPDLVFILSRGPNDRCQLLEPAHARKLITVHAPQLLHPAPVMLRGIDEVLKQRNEWNR
jgi:iron complex transport system substrate-binding protein